MPDARSIPCGSPGVREFWADTWSFIRENLWRRARHRLPEGQDSGMLEARLSGVDVVTILSVTKRMTMPWSEEFARHRAIARRVYAAVAEVVDQIDPSAAKDGTPVPPIVIDDKIPEV